MGKVAAAWTHFGYKVDATTGKFKHSGKPTCKLCKAETSNCGGMTNLWNHLWSIHHTKLLSNEPSGGVQPIITMDFLLAKWVNCHGLSNSYLIIQPELKS